MIERAIGWVQQQSIAEDAAITDEYFVRASIAGKRPAFAARSRPLLSESISTTRRRLVQIELLPLVE